MPHTFVSSLWTVQTSCLSFFARCIRTFISVTKKGGEGTPKSESEGSTLPFYMLRALSSVITKQLLQSLFKQFSSRVTSSKWEEAKGIRGW